MNFYSLTLHQMVIIIHPMYSTAVENEDVEDKKKAASSTTTPAQTETTTVANLAIDKSPPKEDSDLEEADYTNDDCVP